MRYHYGEPTYRCLRCLDSGMVIVHHSRTIARAEADPADFERSGVVETMAAACNCDAGRPLYEAKKFLLQRFSETRHCESKAIRIEDRRREVLDFIAAVPVILRHGGTHFNPD